MPILFLGGKTHIESLTAQWSRGNSVSFSSMLLFRLLFKQAMFVSLIPACRRRECARNRKGPSRSDHESKCTGKAVAVEHYLSITYGIFVGYLDTIEGTFRCGDWMSRLLRGKRRVTNQEWEGAKQLPNGRQVKLPNSVILSEAKG